MNNQDKKPLVSIIVPVCNVAPYLRRSLDSIANQTYKHWECLLIDDGSRDESGTICDEYVARDSRFSVFHSENRGVAMARQYGINKAQGEYSIHIDADDWIESNMLEDMIGEIKKASTDMLITDYYINQNGNIKKERQHLSSLENESIMREMISGNVKGFLWNKMIRHILYTSANATFSPDINYGEDCLICIQLLKADINVSYLPKAYYHYCIRENSITSNYTCETFGMRKRYVERLKELLPSTKWGGVISTCAYKIKIEALYADVLTKENFYNFCPSKIPQILSVLRPDVLPFAIFAYLGAFDIGKYVYKFIHLLGKRLKHIT